MSRVLPRGIKVLVIASHSGGHITPAIAFSQEIEDKAGELVFITSDGLLERKILKGRKNVLYLRRSKNKLSVLLNLLYLFFKSRVLISKIKPDLIAGFGGYLSIPFIFWAHFKKIPSIIHEQNVVVGQANKLLARFCDKIIFSFPNSQLSDKLSGKAVFLGNPVRKGILSHGKEESRKYLKLEENLFTILVIGGSQGAHRINFAVLEVLKDKIFSGVQVIHISGMEDFQYLKQEYEKIGIKYCVFPFFEEMDFAFSASDLVVSRAGASSLAELACLGIPAILIPYPYAGFHQWDNACYYADRGAAIVLKENEDMENSLKEKIKELKDCPEKLKNISEKLCRLSNVKVREEMVGLAMGMIKKKL